ncbi:male sterility protein-domain-containing protein [Jimgerdemannia flammicorona]|uniref:Male sterility protein-domain-containing protein n=2 Tax=Jimgerdemannia flammicorona TaxID=994334 RepID=A0A433DCI6_9FUNG|nr:male sterility protein-domain-containing protein [Jimgerdemannia flammicorona]RUS32942.1 male sterility protein-domain-containing protein [Jimgerdemannia flammicorona]
MSHVTNFFNDKTILLTGGTGFLGMCLVEKLLRTANISKIFILVRGSTDRLTQIWRNHLPHHAEAMIRSGKVTPLVGDVALPQLGLSVAQIDELSRTVQIVIHGAANISLKASLATLFKDNVKASLDLAELATRSFVRLERYIHISTAYVNSHLADGSIIKEDFYWHTSSNAEEEYRQVSQTGDSPYTKLFPFPYAYGKHLVERLLLLRYPNLPLLIMRPTCIGPAVQEPHPGFEIRGSSPASGFVFGFLSSKKPVTYWPSTRNMDGHNIIDEIPVDFVVNSIIVHAAYGTMGIAHSSTSCSAPLKLRDQLECAWKTMPAAGRPQFVFTSDLKHSEFCRTARLYFAFGNEWFYDDQKTRELMERMSPADGIAFNVDVRSFNRWSHNSKRAAVYWYELTKNEKMKQKKGIMPVQAGQLALARL